MQCPPGGGEGSSNGSKDNNTAREKVEDRHADCSSVEGTDRLGGEYDSGAAIGTEKKPVRTRRARYAG